MSSSWARTTCKKDGTLQGRFSPSPSSLTLHTLPRFSATSMNLSVSHWENTIGYASGQNPYNFGEPGYYSFLMSGSNVSASDPSNGDTLAATKAIEFLSNRSVRDATSRLAWTSAGCANSSKMLLMTVLRRPPSTPATPSPPEPFVLFMPTRGAHPPYGAPAEFHNKFSLNTVKQNIKLQPPNPVNKPKYMSVTEGIPFYRNLTTLNEDIFYKIEAVYLGMVAYTGKGPP